MSRKERVLEALMMGEELTPRQISARYSLANPREAVRQLRMEGYSIYANKRTNARGESKTFYRLGTPRRSHVAMGYQVLGV